MQGEIVSGRAILGAGVLMLVTSTAATAEQWRERVAEVLRRVEGDPTPAVLREALEVAWRADDWQVGVRLAERARQFGGDEPLLARAARALWRGGELEAAEELLAALPAEGSDPVLLAMRIQSSLSRGEVEAARRDARRLEELRDLTAGELFQVFAARVAADDFGGVVALLERCVRVARPSEGYPAIHLAETLRGLGPFFASVGEAPLNRVTSFGSAAMRVLAGFNLPYCMAFINGKGPYRLIVDTGGSITLSLDTAIADEIGLKTLAEAVVHGVGGKQESGQALVDALHAGEIECRRVLTRVFELPAPVRGAADGILGAGIFSSARLTLDFESARLVVSPAIEAAAAGEAVELRIVGDAKLVAPVRVDGRRRWAVLDTGAGVLALSPSFIRLAFPQAAAQRLPGAGVGVGTESAVPVTLAPVADFVLWGREFADQGALGLEALDSLLSPIIGLQTDVLVGMPIFRRMSRFTVEFPSSRGWVQWLEE